MEVLVTGGAGYIGSHTCLELLNAGYNVIVADNLCNSSYESLKRVQAITGKTLKFYQADINDEAGMNQIFSENKVDAVVHFAGLKAVGESVQNPLEYYRNNISGTLVLLDCMRKHGVKNMVFSSSATVYGLPRTVPIKEDFPLSTTNPYGSTKLMIENILTDIYRSDEEWNIILLRYFNPIGAHESGMIGEDPDGIPNNLVPYIAKVAVGRLPYVNVFGNDYKTKDGTGVRDYIHVVDLAEGHLKALEKINGNPGLAVYNLGTGVGYSVLEIIDNFGKACGKEIPYRITDRRPGDIDICYADVTKAKKELGWQARYGIDKMCKDTWNWQNKNPEGYR
jgi:UDP-glucose 4-epimerase